MFPSIHWIVVSHTECRWRYVRLIHWWTSHNIYLHTHWSTIRISMEFFSIEPKFNCTLHSKRKQYSAKWKKKTNRWNLFARREKTKKNIVMLVMAFNFYACLISSMLYVVVLCLCCCVRSHSAANSPIRPIQHTDAIPCYSLPPLSSFCLRFVLSYGPISHCSVFVCIVRTHTCLNAPAPYRAALCYVAVQRICGWQMFWHFEAM